MAASGQAPQTGNVIELRRQPRGLPITFALEPDAEARAALAKTLGIDAVRKLRLTGEITPDGKTDWTLNARLGATVVQPCVVTLAPVTTRIDVDVLRHYQADYAEPEGEEAEMPEDETTEALPDRLDLSALLVEALALALPDYPRADGAELTDRVFAAPGVAPMTDDDAKPLAGLAALRSRMNENAPDDGEDTSGDGGA